ncbi:MAG: IPT/TIG domain-containing protein [bacterium]
MSAKFMNRPGKRFFYCFIFLIFLSGCLVGSKPAIIKIDPPMGPTYGGYKVVILGHNFGDDPDVYFGNRKIKIKKVEHFSRITIDIPEGSEGKLPVMVQNEDNSRVILDDGFEYMQFPYIQSVVPSAGPAIGGTWLKIEGKNFDPHATVYFGKNMARNPKVNATQIMVIAPAGKKGKVKISITNPNGNSHIYRNYYTYE